MTLATVNLLSFGQVSEAFGIWCRRWSVKDLMRQFGVAEQTAKSWRAGHLPASKHLIAMVALWRQPFLTALFAAALENVERDLVSDLESVEAQLASIREKLRHETARHHRLCLDAGKTGPGNAPAVGADAGDVGGAGRSGGDAAGTGGVLASVGRGTARTLGAILLLTAALHGPISDLLEDGSFGARTGRHAPVVRVRIDRNGRGA